MNAIIIRAVAVPLTLSVALATLSGAAFAAERPAAAPVPTTTVAGAMPNDKTMTCADIKAERTTIMAAVAATFAKKEQAQKSKKRLFGFAKGLASVALPGMGMLGGGMSSLGGLAAQQAGQAALNAAGDGNSGVATPTEARPNAVQQDRLTRLDSIATYRQCAA